MRRGVGSHTRVAANNAVKCSPPLNDWIGAGHDDGKEVPQLKGSTNSRSAYIALVVERKYLRCPQPEVVRPPECPPTPFGLASSRGSLQSDYVMDGILTDVAPRPA